MILLIDDQQIKYNIVHDIYIFLQSHNTDLQNPNLDLGNRKLKS